jgi:hypothetical protein
LTQNKKENTKYYQTNNNSIIDNNKKTNYFINDKIKGKEVILNLFGIKPKKKIFTKLQIKNDKAFGLRNNNNIIIEDNANKLNIRDKPYKLNADIINNNRNSFEKQSHGFNDEFNSNNYDKSYNNNSRPKNLNNLKIINVKNINNKNNSLKKKLINYNIMELKQYNRLVNQINININNIARSIQRTRFDNYARQNYTNDNNVINLNVILNNTLNNNNNKNLDSLQNANYTINNIKKNLPGTPSQMRFIPNKKSTLPSITISDRIKPKINARKFKSINNSKYLKTETNYDKVEKQKRLFLNNVIKKHQYFKLNYPKNYRINANIYNY